MWKITQYFNENLEASSRLRVDGAEAEYYWFQYGEWSTTHPKYRFFAWGYGMSLCGARYAFRAAKAGLLAEHKKIPSA